MLNMIKKNVEHLCKLIGSEWALKMDDLSIFYKIDRKPPAALPRGTAGVTDLHEASPLQILSFESELVQ